MTADRQPVILAGGSGFIGRALTESLIRSNQPVLVLTRKPRGNSSRDGIQEIAWNGKDLGPWVSSLAGAAAVVNLAGAGIADARWTSAYRREIIASRLDSTRALVAAIERVKPRPRVLVQGSAVGWYGDRGEEVCPETAAAGKGFLAELAVAWEEASEPVEALGVRRVVVRTGVVLSSAGGALQKMLPVFRLGLGGPLGSGQQWFPWIHLADEVAAIRFLMAQESLSGPFNLVAPGIVRQGEFARALGNALHRPAVLPAPAFALRWLFGEMSAVLLGGQRVEPARLLAAGFVFRFPELQGALADLLGRKDGA
jgi:hypothetical protein